MTSVYLMKNMANGYYKIGSSQCPIVRERTLQAQEPDIRLLASVNADCAYERTLHQRYARKRVRGEWFALNYGDLLQLKGEFSVEIGTIDPPIEVIEGVSWRARIHRYSPVHEYTWVTRRRGDFLFEVPFAMSRAEVEEQVSAESWGSSLSPELRDVLSVSLRNYLRDDYEIDGLKVELREICCLGTGESRGFVVVEPQYSHDRFFPWADPARHYFERMRKYLDGYARLSRDDSTP
jgi:hypothetical protein